MVLIWLQEQLYPGRACHLAYLLYPALGFMNRFDFHSIVLAVPFLLFALDAQEHGRPKAATILIILAMACNEEVGLTVFALGLYLSLARKRLKLGLTWAFIGLTWSLIAFFVVIPYFRGAVNDVTLRYAWLGSDLPTILQTLLTRQFPLDPSTV